MTMSLQDYRDYVRAYFDADTQDFPDTLIDTWSRKGSKIIARKINTWTHYEAVSTLPVVSGTADYTAPASLAQIEHIWNNYGPLERITKSEGELRYSMPTPLTGRPVAYAVWGGKVTLYPTPGANDTYNVRGFRPMSDWVALGAGQAPDMPDDFHDLLLEYVMFQAHLFYDQDPILANVRNQSFESGLAELLASDQQAPLDSPVVMNGSMPVFTLTRARYPFE